MELHNAVPAKSITVALLSLIALSYQPTMRHALQGRGECMLFSMCQLEPSLPCYRLATRLSAFPDWTELESFLDEYLPQYIPLWQAVKDWQANPDWQQSIQDLGGRGIIVFYRDDVRSHAVSYEHGRIYDPKRPATEYHSIEELLRANDLPVTARWGIFPLSQANELP